MGDLCRQYPLIHCCGFLTPSANDPESVPRLDGRGQVPDRASTVRSRLPRNALFLVRPRALQQQSHWESLVSYIHPTLRRRTVLGRARACENAVVSGLQQHFTGFTLSDTSADLIPRDHIRPFSLPSPVQVHSCSGLRIMAKGLPQRTSSVVSSFPQCRSLSLCAPVRLNQ
jgi:hypothetical protein